jgi:hypothetical protein
MPRELDWAEVEIKKYIYFYGESMVTSSLFSLDLSLYSNQVTLGSIHLTRQSL